MLHLEQKLLSLTLVNASSFLLLCGPWFSLELSNSTQATAESSSLSRQAYAVCLECSKFAQHRCRGPFMGLIISYHSRRDWSIWQPARNYRHLSGKRERASSIGLKQCDETWKKQKGYLKTDYKTHVDRNENNSDHCTVHDFNKRPGESWLLWRMSTLPWHSLW